MGAILQADTTLADAIGGLFPPGIGVAAMAVGEARVAALFHVEQRAICNAVAHRQQEFAAGRLAAHQAQGALGLKAQAVPMAAGRAPVWPVGLCGSISHAGGVAAAAVGKRDTWAALGLDIEEDAELPAEIIDTVLLPAEQTWLARQADAGQLARVIFSIKEAVYKAQFPLSQQLIGFEALEVALGPPQGRFEARFQQHCPPFARGERLSGRFARHGGLILSALAIPG